MTLHSSDATRLKFSNSPTGAASDTITVSIPANQSTSADFYVQGFDSTGSVGYTASAPTYGTLNSTVPLAPSGLVIQSPGGFGANFTMSTGVGNATLNMLQREVRSYA